MKKFLYYTFVALLFVTGIGLLPLANSGFLSFRQPYLLGKSATLQPNKGSVAFVNVNVVPMDSERILQEQTVLVSNGFIVTIGERDMVELPHNTQIIEAKGKYLMPGLADMHVHIKEENELLLFVAHGVTTVRDMWGTTGIQLALGFPNQLDMRAQTAAGTLIGPTIYTAGPILEGDPPTSPLMSVFRTPEEGVEAVAWQKAQGYDFVKVYDNLSIDTYHAILKAAQEERLPVMGHAPKEIGLPGVLAGGQRTIEHLTGYIDPDAAEFIIPKGQLDEFAVMTREAGVWNCPTFAVYQMHVPAEELFILEERAEMAYVSPRMKILWKYMLRPGAMQNISYDGHYPTRIAELYQQMTKALHQNGAKIILGTDTDNPYLVPGASLLDELDYLIEAGFSPYEAIEAGTRNAAQALNRQDEFGTVTQGKRADLILLAANPLEDVSHVRQQEGIMVRGQWFSQAQLQTLLAELVDSYKANLLERFWPVSLLILAIGLMTRRMTSRKWVTHQLANKEAKKCG